MSSASGSADDEEYLPHRFGQPADVPAISDFGGPHIARYTTSTHDQAAYLTTKPAVIQEMIDHYTAKIDAAADDIALVKRDFQDGAETLIISYGITSSSAAVAVREARARGIRGFRAGPPDPLAGSGEGHPGGPGRDPEGHRAGDEHGPVSAGDRTAGSDRRRRDRREQDEHQPDLAGRDPARGRLAVSTTGAPATPRATYMTDEIGPLPFCPGCGHHVVTKALDKALVKLQLDPRQVVIVTDIGCIGLSDRYFTTNAFHGLHGRSVTYACGLKLARPELTVIALKGDGGCGIGGTHVLNVARRNIGITLIVANNFNYGMTGGQHSVTTPSDGITSTTPWGNVEGPMDLCGTAIAAGAAWAARCTMFDKDLADVMAQAIAQPGFALLDVWELCTAYYAPRNKIKKKELDDLLERYGLKLGVLADRPRPEYSARYRAGLCGRQTGGRAPTHD